MHSARFFGNQERESIEELLDGSLTRFELENKPVHWGKDGRVLIEATFYPEIVDFRVDRYRLAGNYEVKLSHVGGKLGCKGPLREVYELLSRELVTPIKFKKDNPGQSWMKVA